MSIVHISISYADSTISQLEIDASGYADKALSGWKMAKKIYDRVQEKSKKNEPITMFDFADFLKSLNIPQSAIPVWESVQLRTPIIQEGIKGYATGFSVSAAVVFGNTPVTMRILVVDKGSKIEQGATTPPSRPSLETTSSKTQEAIAEENPLAIVPYDPAIAEARMREARENENKREGEANELLVKDDNPLAIVPYDPAIAQARMQEAQANENKGEASKEFTEEEKKQVQLDIGISASIEIPKGWKLSSVIPSIKGFDRVSLPYGRFIVSTFEYDDDLFATKVKEGLSIIAGLELVDSLKEVQDFLDSFKSSLVVEGMSDLFIQGQIPVDVTQASLKSVIPARIGIDFQKLYEQGKLSSPPAVKRFMAGNLEIELKGKDGSINGSMDAILVMASQEQPLTFRAGVGFRSNGASFFGEMDGMYDPAFGTTWLALGNFGMYIDIDYTVQGALIALGIPFSGIGFKGTMMFGSDHINRTMISLAAKMGVSSQSVPEILFAGKANRIELTQFIALLNKMVGRQVSEANLPTVIFSDLELYVSPKDITLGQDKYKQGMKASASMQFNDFKGYASIEISTDPAKKGSFKAIGAIDPIEKRNFRFVKGTTISIPGTEKYLGPFIIIDISPEKSFYQMSGVVELPAIKVKQEVTLNMNQRFIEGYFETVIFDAYKANLYLKTSNMPNEDFEARFNLQQDFMQSFKKNMLSWFDDQISNARKEYEIFDQRARDTRAKYEEVKKQITAKAEVDKRRIDVEIAVKRSKAREALKKRDAVIRECEEKAKSLKFWEKEFWQGVGKCFESVGRDAQALVKQLDKDASDLEKKLIDIRREAEHAIAGQMKLMAGALDLIAQEKILKEKVLHGLRKVSDAITILDITAAGGSVIGSKVTFSIKYAIDIGGKRTEYELIDQELSADKPFESLKNIGKSIIESIKSRVNQ